jgi:hypothetical protein
MQSKEERVSPVRNPHVHTLCLRIASHTLPTHWMSRTRGAVTAGRRVTMGLQADMPCIPRDSGRCESSRQLTDPVLGQLSTEWYQHHAKDVRHQTSSA